MWISKEEYNQLKTERDYYEQQLKNWEQEWKNAYVKTNPIDGKDKYKTTCDIENLEINIPESIATCLKSGMVIETSYMDDIHSGYMEERDWLNLVSRYEQELKSKNELVEELQKEVTRLQKQEIEMNNYKQQFKPILDSHTRLENYVSELKKDLAKITDSKNELNEALDHEAKRNKELFKLNNRLCDKLSELEKENNSLKDDLSGGATVFFPNEKQMQNLIENISILRDENKRLKEKLDLFPENNYFNAYFLESEIKQLIDLLDVALRDMNLHSNCTLYELEYDSKAHIYRIVTTPKTK